MRVGVASFDSSLQKAAPLMTRQLSLAVNSRRPESCFLFLSQRLFSISCNDRRGCCRFEASSVPVGGSCRQHRTDCANVAVARAPPPTSGRSLVHHSRLMSLLLVAVVAAFFERNRPSKADLFLSGSALATAGVSAESHGSFLARLIRLLLRSAHPSLLLARLRCRWASLRSSL